MSYSNRGKKQFSVREKRAYDAGRAYGLAKQGKRVNCKMEKDKSSFRNGLKAVRGK